MKGSEKMPTRFLKESICRSDEIDRLSYFTEVMFYRLIVNCDDYGRYDARLKIIKNICFPLKDITEKDIEKGLKSLVNAGLIIVYESDGKPYLQLITWDKHQTTRAKKSKYPAYDENCKLMYANDNESMQNAAKKISDTIAEEQQEPPVITLLLNTGDEYGIVQKDIDEWKELYPAVDVMQELRNMKGWCKENKAKRKTERGIRRFITGWLSREQDRGGTRGFKRPDSNNSYGSITEKLLSENRSDLK